MHASPPIAGFAAEPARPAGTTCFYPQLTAQGHPTLNEDNGWVAPIGCAPYAFFSEVSCPLCGDGVCSVPGEDASSCPDDCRDSKHNRTQPGELDKLRHSPS